TCSNGTQNGYSCNGLGTCNASSTTDCSPYVCLNASVCATTCNDDSGCVASSFCNTSHVCQADQLKGSPCAGNSQCVSGSCVDGFCCDGPCSGTCQACSAVKKGAGVNGECGGVKVDTDPDFECPDDGPSMCGRNGVCDGIGSCKLYPTGTACGATSCNSG